MEIKDFIGKVVIERQSQKRYVLSEITSPYIAAKAEVSTSSGRGNYIWGTINGDPFTNGVLKFEDSSLAEPFRVAYTAYCRSKDAYWEDYGYWMRKD
jgi:hypothetical protein